MESKTVMEVENEAVKEERLPNSLQRDLEAFKRYLETYPGRGGRPRSPETIRGYMRVVKRLAEWLSKRGISNFREVSGSDLEEFVLNWRSEKAVWGPGLKRIVKRRGETSWRWRNFVITVVALFYKWLLGAGEEYPPCVRGLKKLMIKPPLEERSRIRSPDELLSDEELIALLRACEGGINELTVKRNRAFIAVLYESGCRIGEILSLKNRDVVPTEYGFRLWVSGKTGRRAVPIIDSARYLLEWANVHPYGDDPEAPLFIAIKRGVPERRALTRNGAYTLIQTLAKRAGIRKPVFCHLFRHSRASELVAYTSESYLKKLMGWSMGSYMPSIYVHLSGSDIEREVLRIHGIIPERQLKPVLEKKVCQFCGFENDPHFTYCARCGRPLKSSVAVLRELSEAHRALEEVERLRSELERLRGLEERIRRFEEFTRRFMGLDPETLTEIELAVTRRREAEAEKWWQEKVEASISQPISDR